MRRQPTLLLKKSLLSELTVTLVAVDIHEPSGAKGMIQDSIKTGKVEISVALESARSGHVARAAINAALLLVAGDDELGLQGQWTLTIKNVMMRLRCANEAVPMLSILLSSAVHRFVVGCASVLKPVVPVVIPLVPCGFTYHSRLDI